MYLQNAVDEWIATKKIENVSDRTLVLYESITKELIEYLGNIPVKEFTASSVRKFLAYQSEREGRFGKLSDATIHKYFSIVRTFSRWLKEQEYKVVSATEKVKAPRVEKKLPESMSDEEVERLFRYLEAYCSSRVMLIFSFFLDTGARLNEVVNLDVSDLHLDDGWVKVYGKGKRERILPLGETLERLLANYLATVRPEIANKGEKALFVTQDGCRYTREGLATLIKTKLKKIGVQGRYGPHKLRHTFATNYLRNDGPLEQLRIIMGHRDISTTQRYLSLVPNDIKRAHRSASPMDRLMKKT